MATFFFYMFVAAIAASLATLFIYLTSKFRHQKSSNLPPGSFGWPLIGEIDLLLKSGNIMDDSFVRSRMEKYDSRAFKSSLFGYPIVFLCGPAGNKFIFSNENKLLVLWWPSSMRRLAGIPSLLDKAGEEAKRTRRMLMSFLNLEALQRFISTMDMITQRHFETNWEGQNEVKAFPLIKRYMFDVACYLFLSIDDPHKISQLCDHFNNIRKGVLTLPINFPGTTFYRAMRSSGTIRAEIKEMIKHRRAALESKTASPTQDLLSYLLVHPDETGYFMPENEIANNIVGLLLASQDTSSTVLFTAMKYLAEIPEVCEKFLKEQMDIAMAKEPGEALNWEDIKKMRYSGNVVAEVNRVCMTLSGGIREALVDFTYAGYTIPKGWKVLWTNSTHSDPSIFPNPRNFDPSRFEGEGPEPFTYVAFGGGARMCLGKEYSRLLLLVFLHHALKRFKWELLCPDEKIELDLNPAPSKGLPISLRPRQS